MSDADTGTRRTNRLSRPVGQAGDQAGVYEGAAGTSGRTPTLRCRGRARRAGRERCRPTPRRARRAGSSRTSNRPNRRTGLWTAWRRVAGWVSTSRRARDGRQVVQGAALRAGPGKGTLGPTLTAKGCDDADIACVPRAPVAVPEHTGEPAHVRQVIGLRHFWPGHGRSEKGTSSRVVRQARHANKFAPVPEPCSTTLISRTSLA